MTKLSLLDQPQPPLFEVIVKLHPEEEYYPMNPLDFIRLSRFRHHIGGGTDFGYHKELREWIKGNDHTPEYYNIPVDYINSFGLNPDGRNRRPRDDNRGDKWNVFLEPDNNLKGELSTGTEHIKGIEGVITKLRNRRMMRRTNRSSIKSQQPFRCHVTGGELL